MRPKLVINTTDYAPYLEGLAVELNDLDADGSGRDVMGGLMYRTRVAQKVKLSAKLIPVTEEIFQQLSSDLSTQYVSVTYLNPKTNTEQTGTFYCSTINYGNQLYSASDDITHYADGSFNLIER